jgi:putative protein-disulfide isomerase
MKLVFIGDPMCSWCYGFAKELRILAERHPALPLTILAGGVRAGATDLLDEAGKQFRLAHWARVEENSGLQFNRQAFLARENFVYDSEPVCRAVVTARQLAPSANQLQVFDALQRAFYADGRDTTDGKVLAAVAAAALHEQGNPVSVDAFHAAWSDPATIAATAAEFTHVRALGITSFPQLLLDNGERLINISPGYAKADRLDQALSEALR